MPLYIPQTSTFTGEVSGADLKATGLTGATAASRHVGATASGAPTAGTFAVGDFVIDQTGKVYICTAAGTPGTWTAVSGGGSSYLGARYHQASATAQSIPGTAATVVNFDTSDFDTNSAVTTGSTWKFTAPSAGKYHVSAAVLFASAVWGTTSIAELSLNKNGTKVSTLCWLQTQPASNTGSIYVPLAGGDTINLAANDYIDVRAYQGHSSTTALALNGDSTYNYIAIDKVG